MIKLIISGCNGYMGQVLTSMAANDPEIEVIAGFDPRAEKKSGYPVYASPMEYSGTSDVIIDFSHPSALESLLSYSILKQIPVVFCTTGYTDQQISDIERASQQVPLFRSANMSLGINLISVLLKRAAAVLGENFDVEIVDRHHNRKIDAPSGTALMLADAVREGLPYEAEYVYDRHSVRTPRDKHSIGFSAVRGGTITGEHEVIFFVFDEVIEFKHTVYSRDVFAVGALRAAKYMAGITEPGLYNMNDMLANV